MATNRHKNAQGFYRPESYFGLWSIVPESLNHMLAVVGTLDLNAMAQAALLKADITPSTPLPTEKPDVGGKKKAKKAELDDKQKKHDELGKDIADHQKALDDKKGKKSKKDQEEIDKSESDLNDKKANHAKSAEELEACRRELDEMEDDEEADAEAESRLKAQAPGVPSEEQAPALYELHNDTAVISLSGPITKHPTSFQSLFGGASTVQTIHALRQAEADSDVTRIALRIDSPGGTCAGVYELMQEVARCKKPLWTYGEDTMASAGYFAGCNAQFIACNPTAMVGSVGTLVMLQDTSGKYAMNGIKVLSIGTGKHKGAGMDGTEITDEQKAYFKSIVDDTNANFIQAVKDSRGLTPKQFQEVTDAGVFIGQKALDIGLVDAVMGWDEFLAKFEADTDGAKLQAAAMEAQRVRVLAESRQELAAILEAVNNNATFAIKQYLAGASVADAKLAMADQILAADALRAKTGISAADGQEALPLTAKTPDNVQAEFIKLVDAYQAEKKCSRRAATCAVVKAHPDLHAEWLASMQQVAVTQNGTAKP